MSHLFVFVFMDPAHVFLDVSGLEESDHDTLIFVSSYGLSSVGFIDVQENFCPITNATEGSIHTMRVLLKVQ